MKRALITGVSGFVGLHLAICLKEKHYQVWGLDRKPPPNTSKISFYKVDLNQEKEFTDFVRQVEPTHIFHLAGLLGNFAYSELYQANVLGTIRLFETLLAVDWRPIVIIAGTSGVYGATTPAENPLNEAQPLRPLSHYATSKVAQEMVGLQYFFAHQIPVVRIRTFNLVGPGMSPSLFASNFARQVALLEHTGRDGSVTVGNLWPKRDYVDVRDAVQAYIVLAETGQPGEAYHVCSGRSYSVQECVDILLSLAKVHVCVEQDKQRVRAVEIPNQVGDFSRLQQLTGWHPQITLETSLVDLLDDWRKVIAREDSV
ncbi:MAG: GDP-mannose 4,6-dehydratase [Anaerolineae bacterium]|nr:GDP-mannose 4,6-dehydratase [Anaerolineae bacterium]